MTSREATQLKKPVICDCGHSAARHICGGCKDCQCPYFDKPRTPKQVETEKDFQQVADEHGENAVAWIREEVDALEHAQECLGLSCPRRTHLPCMSEDAAREQIEEGPLSIEVRSGWHTLGDSDGAKPAEYNILLSTGGPASRIVGDLSEHGPPETAHFEFQDWFKPWTRARLSGEQEDILLRWAQCFYFGE